MGDTFSLVLKAACRTLLAACLLLPAQAGAADAGPGQGPPAVPVRAGVVERKMVSEQIELVGTAAAGTQSVIAAETSGLVERFPVAEGEFVKKGGVLAGLKDADLRLRLKGAVAASEKIKANLENAQRELERAAKLKNTNSIAAANYDNSFFAQRALEQELLRSRAEIDLLEYQITQKTVLAPFDGYVAREHTQVGEWIQVGGPVVTLLDLQRIEITVDVPERYAVQLKAQAAVSVRVRSVSESPLAGRIQTVLPQGDPRARTFPVKIDLPNPGFRIKDGMEAVVAFGLATQRDALLVPKDAIVTAGSDRRVFLIDQDKAFPVGVKVLGYYDALAAVEGNLAPGAKVVVRGNERLMPGQAVKIVD